MYGANKNKLEELLKFIDNHYSEINEATVTNMKELKDTAKDIWKTEQTKIAYDTLNDHLDKLGPSTRDGFYQLKKRIIQIFNEVCMSTQNLNNMITQEASSLAGVQELPFTISLDGIETSQDGGPYINVESVESSLIPKTRDCEDAIRNSIKKRSSEIGEYAKNAFYGTAIPAAIESFYANFVNVFQELFVFISSEEKEDSFKGLISTSMRKIKEAESTEAGRIAKTEVVINNQ